MKSVKNLTLLLLLMLGLAACHGNDDHDVVVDPTPTPTPTHDPDPNQLKSLAKLSATDEPGAIGNAADLIDDINTLFNEVEPLDLETGDDIDLVFLRAEGRVND